MSSALFAQQTYIVKPGDSLMTISNQFYQTHQCWQIIMKENSLKSANEIEVNQKLTIPNSNQCSLTGNLKKIVIVPKAPEVKNKKKKKSEKLELEKDTFILYGKQQKQFRPPPKNKSPVNEEVQKKSPSKDNSSKKNNRLLVYTIQLSSFPDYNQALIEKEKLETAGIDIRIKSVIIKQRKWFRLFTGEFSTKKKAINFAKTNKINLFSKDYFVTQKELLRPRARKRTPLKRSDIQSRSHNKFKELLKED
jgi:LysM repeat protein